MADLKTSKRLKTSIIILILLALCLAATTFALIYASVVVENNRFATGTVKINLNDGQPVIRENEFTFEPGMTVKKDFFIENESTVSVYYKLYLENVTGDLADDLLITIKDNDKILCSGTAEELNRKDVDFAEELMENERKDLSIYFYFPKEKGNDAQSQKLSFTVSAVAVQTKNNPEKQFD